MAGFRPARLQQYFKKVALGIAYACSIGGVSTKTGTGTNLAFSAVYGASFHDLRSLFPGPCRLGNLTGKVISYGRWVIFGLPASVLMLLSAWALLTLGGLGRPGYRFPTEAFQQRYAKLGRIRRDEVFVAALCALVVLGWLFRAPAWGHGYAELLPEPEAFTDATVVLAVTLPLFLLPNSKDGNHAILVWSRWPGGSSSEAIFYSCSSRSSSIAAVWQSQ